MSPLEYTGVDGIDLRFLIQEADVIYVNIVFLFL